MNRAGSYRTFVAMALAPLASACVLQPPHYDDTTFVCEPSAPMCPADFACVDGFCVRGGPDDDPDSSGQADAGNIPPDAGQPPVDSDASALQVMTFGERGNADQRGVVLDTYLAVDAPDDNFGDHEHMHIDADPIKVSLIRFDLSAIPPSATIVRAELDVEVTNPIETGAFQFFALTEAWDVATATWNERAAGLPWASPGAFGASAAPVALVEFAPRETGARTVELPINTVQSWVSAPAQNYGAKIVSSSPDGRGGDLESCEAAIESARPMLRVSYRL